MGKDNEPKEIPADKFASNLPPAQKPNLFTRLTEAKNKFEEKRAKAEAERERSEELAGRKRWNKFRKTPLGKVWAQITKRMNKTERGKKVLTGIALTFYGILLIGVFLIIPLAGTLLDKLFYPNQIELSQKLKDQGFDQTCSGTKHCSPEGVAYKILDKQEKTRAQYATIATNGVFD